MTCQERQQVFWEWSRKTSNVGQNNLFKKQTFTSANTSFGDTIYMQFKMEFQATMKTLALLASRFADATKKKKKKTYEIK